MEIRVEHLLSVRNQTDPLTESLGLIHEVGGEQDRRAPRVKVTHDLLQNILIDRIQTRKRLVKNQKLGLMNDCADELDLLLHSLGQIFDLLISPLTQTETLQPGKPALLSFGPAHTTDLSEERHELDALHLPVDAALLRQVADPCTPRYVWVRTEQLHGPLIGMKNPHDHSDRRRLP